MDMEDDNAAHRDPLFDAEHGILHDSAPLPIPSTGPWQDTVRGRHFSPAKTGWRKTDDNHLVRAAQPAKSFYDKIHVIAVTLNLDAVGTATHPECPAEQLACEYPAQLIPDDIAALFSHLWNALGLLSIQTPPGRTVATLVNHKDLSAHILADGVHNLIVDTSNTSYTATMHRVALQLLASPGQGINQAGKVSNYRILLKRVQQEVL